MDFTGKIEVMGLTKRFGSVTAVQSLSFTANPGRVTGFLGPNGSGKTTSLSMLLGLVTPDDGTATIGGVPYAQLDRPASTVGSALSANFHPAHTGRAHLDIVRRAIGVEATKVDEKLELVGLVEAADRKTGGYSLGMRQRLALAAALLGDPDVIVLDEPINGLDPEGIRWIRTFLRFLASEGKTVLLSSHLLSEVEHTVDDVIIIRRGQLAYAGRLDGLRGGDEPVLVATPDNQALAAVLHATGASVQGMRGEIMRVTGVDPETVGRAALSAGLPLSHLSQETTNLEERFLALVDSDAEDSSSNSRVAGQPADAPAAGHTQAHGSGSEAQPQLGAAPRTTSADGGDPR